MFGKTFNAGQYCVAPDRVFVPVGSVEEFLVACREAIDPAAETTAIIDEHHHDRLAGLVQDAVGKGARYVRLGYRQSGADRLVPPAALVGIDNSMRIAHEEVFGPLFTLHPYERCDEVIDEINAGPAPLAAYYFGPAGETSDRFVRETRSGGVVINDIILQVGLEHLPFGGVGQSGMGVYHGRAGFETFSHAKPVVRVRHPLTPHLTPPYPAITERLIRSGLRLQSEILIRKVQRPGG
jgi:coniferyl-aldehyde dehydrogenase